MHCVLLKSVTIWCRDTVILLKGWGPSGLGPSIVGYWMLRKSLLGPGDLRGICDGCSPMWAKSLLPSCLTFNTMTSQGSFFGFPWGGFMGCCLSHVWLFVTPWTIATSLPHSSLPPGRCSNPCPLSQGCYLTISSSAAPFFSCPQSLPASGAFPMSWLFASGGQSTGTSASASVLPMNIQGWFRIALNSLQSKGLSRVYSSRDILKTASHTMSGLKCFHQSG